MAQAAASAQRRRYPLAVHISTLFVVLLAVAGLAMGALAYFRSVAILTRAADDLFDRVARETTHEVQRIATPGEALLDVLAQTRIATAGNLVERLDALALVREGFAVSPNISAIYAGYANGDFFLVRRVRDAPEAREALGAPERAAYLVQSIERRGQERGLGTFVWFDADLARLGIESRPEYTAFDPRTRPWYLDASNAADQIKTAPYVFFTTHEVGVTLARRAAGLKSVVGMDITLQTIGAALARQRITPGTEIALADADGHVIAHPEAARVLLPAPPGQAPERATLDGVGSPVLAVLAGRLPAAGKEAQIAEIDAGGRAWRTLVAPLALRGVEIAPRLVFAMPLDELLVEARRIARDSGAAVAMVLAAALLAALAAASAISRPLRRLVDEANAIRRFEFSRPVEVASIVKEVDELAGTMDEMKRTIRRFLDVSAAVAAEPDLDRLMPRLLDETIAAAGAQGGVLYLAADDGATLTPAAVRIAGGGTDVATLPPIDLAHEPPGHPVPKAVRAGIAQAYSVRRGDAATADLDVLLAAFGDERATLVVAPLANRRRELLGVVAILCPERAGVERELVEFVGALAGASAVSLETKQLIQAQKALFEAFIRLIASAIDAKSPYTGGHCARVPELTKMLAHAACAASAGPFKDFDLSEEEWEAVHLGAWLHDCGKVTTPEYVVDKATKLETIADRIHEVRMRFEVLKRDAEIAYWKRVAEGGDRASLRAMLEAEWRTLDAEFAFVAECNEGGEFMAPERVARLKAIAARTWTRTLDDRIGIAHEERKRKERRPAAPLPAAEPLLADKPEHLIERRPADRMDEGNRWGFRVKTPELLYNRGELYNLSVGRGTLSEEERYKINEHMIQTIIMLSALPFPRHLRRVPEIAGGHHEKMDGTGYPKRLKRDEMSPVARMMAIADIFEALTAADRPYKKAKTLSEAIKIMGFMRKDQHVDPELFELFLTSGVYREYAERFLAPEQIDDVDVAAYVGAAR
jgi:HD-GYP domain-containing protein (c-di-GMP phosphodiesterase class II)/HAMP domain-containing protein